VPKANLNFVSPLTKLLSYKVEFPNKRKNILTRESENRATSAL